MTFLNSSKFLLFLLAASITNLYSDTNSPETNIQEIIESPLIKEQVAVTPFLPECRTLMEKCAGMIGAIATLKGPEAIPFMESIIPALKLFEQIELPDTISQQELYKVFVYLDAIAKYISTAVQKGIDEKTEFNPDFELIAKKETLTDNDFQDIIQKIDASLDALANKANELHQDLWGTLLMHTRNQVIKLDSILQTINNNINNNSAITTKSDISNDIKNLRAMLRQVQKEMSAVEANPDAVIALYHINKAIITYLQEAQSSKYKKWITLDLAAQVMRNQTEPMDSLQDVFSHIVQNNFDLEKLEKDAEKIDLSFINKTTRFISDYIVDPAQKYHLDVWLPCAVLGTLYGAYYFDDNFFTNKDSVFRRWLGFRDHSVGKTVFNSELQLNKPIKFFGKTEAYIYDQMHHITPIGGALTMYISHSLLEQWKGIKPVLLRKIFVTFSKLKGGSLAKTAAKYDYIYPTTTFDDVIGLEYEKSLVYPHLKYIKDPERWDANELTPPTGILLTGPTRSGKTFFARAICGELHKQSPDKSIQFLSINAHIIKEEGIANLMQVAKLLAPCVLFIDEIDLLGLQRNQDKTLLADFLQALSGIEDKDPKKQVIVIGTTNKPENLDTAMLQSGRLALEIRFRYPNLQERKEFFQKRFEKLAIDPAVFEIDLDKLARETSEKSFEDIKLMLDTAFIHVGIKGQIISQEILEWALDTQLRKIIDIDTRKISPDEKRLLSAHFAGQVLTHLLLNMEEKISKVTIRQVVVKVKEESVYEQYYSQNKQTGIEYGSLFTHLDHDTFNLKSNEELAKKAKTLLGSRIAERIMCNSASAAYGWKKNSAFNMIKALIADGIEIKSLSKKGHDLLNDQAQEKLKEFEQEIEQLLLQHKDVLHALTDALEVKQTLNIDQIQHLIDSVQAKK